MRVLTFVVTVASAALVCIFLLTAPAGASFLRWSLERAGGSTAAARLAQGQAIVLLGGRTARVHHAARLQRQTGLPLLITGKGTGDSGYRAESEKMAEILRTQYALQPTWLEKESVDTAQNAWFSRCVLPPGIRKVVLVTDAQHMLRSRAAFHAAGFDVLPAPSPLPDAAEPFDWHHLLPARTVQPVATRALLEWGGAAAMLWEGWFGEPPAAGTCSPGRPDPQHGPHRRIGL